MIFLKKHETKIPITINTLFRLKAHIGYLSIRWNKYMRNFILFKCKKIYLMDVLKTINNLKLSIFFLTNVILNRGTVTFIEQRKFHKNIIDIFVQKNKQYAFTFKWLSGLFTNFREFFFVQNTLKKIEKKGLDFNSVSLNRLPDVSIFFSIYSNKIAINECKCLGIHLIAVINSDNSPNGIDFVIPSNDNSFDYASFLLLLYTSAILLGYSMERLFFFKTINRLYYLKFLKNKIYEF